MSFGNNAGSPNNVLKGIRRSMKNIRRTFRSRFGKSKAHIPAAGLLLAVAAGILATGVLKQHNKDIYQPLSVAAEWSAAMTQTKLPSTTTGGAAFVSCKFVTPVYKAETSLFLGKEKDRIGSITLSDLQVGNQLVTDYTQIIKSKLCTREVIDALKLKISVDDFQERVTVTTIKDSRLFKIAFESTDPKMAADVANALAQAIIRKAAEIIEVNNVKVIDVADVPDSPVTPGPGKNAAIAALIGLAASAGLIFLMEMIDHTFKKPGDIERQLGLNPIGMIPRFIGDKRTGREKPAKSGSVYFSGLSKNLVTIHDPRSAASEAYRTLRTNLSYSSVDSRIKTIVVTSPGVEDGKSTSACNLAISLAQNGQKVLLVDADLRKPKIRKYFGLVENSGLTDILTGKGNFEDYLYQIKDIEGLSILVSGSIPPNPTELLGTMKMKTLIKELSDIYDMVVIDTPPVAELTDAAIIGTMSDGAVLVLSSGETNIEQARKAKRVLENVSVRILGAIMVKLERQGRDRYYYYYYYHYSKNVEA